MNRQAAAQEENARVNRQRLDAELYDLYRSGR